MSHRHLTVCDWCEDAADAVPGMSLPAGWASVKPSEDAPNKLAQLSWWDLCPDCVLARERTLELLLVCARGAWEKAIAGQLRPILEGRGHSKLVLKGRDG